MRPHHLLGIGRLSSVNHPSAGPRVRVNGVCGLTWAVVAKLRMIPSDRLIRKGVMEALSLKPRPLLDHFPAVQLFSPRL